MDPDGPAFYRGQFTLSQTADTFLDTRGWGKGAVWINGHALGRFWNLGPQQTLYVPAPWLLKGKNEIIVFAQNQPKSRAFGACARQYWINWEGNRPFRVDAIAPFYDLRVLVHFDRAPGLVPGVADIFQAHSAHLGFRAMHILRPCQMI